MSAPAETFLPPPPQSGRSVPQPLPEEEPRGLWSQLLTTFRDLSGAFDPFANDADPQVRALGRAARQRRPAHPDDYFVIGDLCARLTPRGRALSETYAAKAVAAYTQAGMIAPAESDTARRALLAFAFWSADAARALDEYEPLKVGVLICERVRQLVGDETMGADVARLADAEGRLRQQLDEIVQGVREVSRPASTVGESRTLTDQGQMLLRQGRASQALDLFERALQVDGQNQAAWLWRAMALTDLARFDEALASYDRALALHPESAGVWNNKGSLLMELGRLDEALACFERAIELSAAASTVKALYWLNKGKALYMLSRFGEAREALQRSYELDPSPEAGAGIAACRERLEPGAA